VFTRGGGIATRTLAFSRLGTWPNRAAKGFSGVKLNLIVKEQQNNPVVFIDLRNTGNN